MKAPEKLEVPVVVKDTDGNEHEVERLVYKLERNGKSRWAELFGTPDRAARTMETVAEALYASAWADDSATLSDVLCSLVAKCDACPAMGAPGCGVSTRCGAVDYEMMLKWLKGDAE